MTDAAGPGASGCSGHHILAVLGQTAAAGRQRSGGGGGGGAEAEATRRHDGDDAGYLERYQDMRTAAARAVVSRFLPAGPSRRRDTESTEPVPRTGREPLMKECLWPG